ncbi:ABC transporter permease subunit [Glycomyces xiaoerkulensis]|uniref:ABC transporter permease subunit n=1 Tax=Glycomyces xiaoerkulensis TaxID=2038139 RepID=UPI000C2655CF|nr:ABC transporter permease subunit [Glycomyces xiaoerkulensis]
MTTATMAEEPAVFTPPQQYRVSGPGLLRSEWTKFWSLRSSWIVLVCAALFGAGIGMAVAADFRFGAEPSVEGGVTGLDVLFGFGIGAVFIAVLGALFITGEYTTGSIRSTMAAAPRRTGVLWSKAAVFASIVLAVYAALVFATFFATQALLADTHLGGMSLSDEGVLRVLTGYVVSTAYLGLLGLAIGAILRNSAGSISFYIGVVLLLPELATMLPWDWVAEVTPYAPGNAPNTLTWLDTTGATLSVGASWLWMGIWTAVSFGLAALLLKRRDV